MTYIRLRGGQVYWTSMGETQIKELVEEIKQQQLAAIGYEEFLILLVIKKGYTITSQEVLEIDL